MADSLVHQKAKPESVLVDVRDFEKVVADNERKIFNTIYSFVGDYDDALDLTQETFICAYRSIDKFRHESNISTWLYRIAINLCKKSRIKRNRQDSIFAGSLDDPDVGGKLTEYSSQEETAEEILETDEEQSIVLREIYSLPRKHKVVIILKYLQDLSYEEMADILGCSIGTVKSRLSRAKGKLKLRLERVAGVDYDKL
jgi:RNA polymerase sigma-70 factor (ECF subfamily)